MVERLNPTREEIGEGSSPSGLTNSSCGTNYNRCAALKSTNLSGKAVRTISPPSVLRNQSVEQSLNELETVVEETVTCAILNIAHTEAPKSKSCVVL